MLTGTTLFPQALLYISTGRKMFQERQELEAQGKVTLNLETEKGQYLRLPRTTISKLQGFDKWQFQQER